MSGAEEQDGKSEAPTEKKLSDAVEKGNTPFSRETVSLGTLLAIVMGLSFLVPKMTQELTSLLLDNFATLEQPLLQSPGDAARLLNSVLVKLMIIMWPLLVFLALGGLIGSLVQNVPSAVLDRVAFKPERLSPAANINRIMGREGLIEFLKTVAKFLALSLLIYAVLKGKINSIFEVGFAEPSLLPATLQQLLIDIAAPTAIFVLFLAIGDVIWTRLKWRHDLKMSRHDIKEEHKNAEGDPMIKHRRRQIAQKWSRSRMMADVPSATLVVVNPTHFAVAMRYVATEGGAPVVLAKGIDHVALKIREISETHGIPTIENKPLARSLFGACEVGEMIPPDYYKAIAEVIHFVESKRQLVRSTRGQSPTV